MFLIATDSGSDASPAEAMVEDGGTVANGSGNSGAPFEVSLNSLEQIDSNPDDMLKDLDALVEALQGRIDELNRSIDRRSRELLENKDYEFVNAEIAQTLEGNITDKDENLLGQVANSVSRQVLQLQGLEEVPNYSTATKPLSQAVTKLEDEIDQLESELEAERARKKDLMRARDLAWKQYDTLATKLSETDVTSSITGTEVRFASSALPPSDPTGPSTRLNTLLGGFVGFILMMGLALVWEHPAIRELRRPSEGEPDEPQSRE